MKRFIILLVIYVSESHINTIKESGSNRNIRLNNDKNRLDNSAVPIVNDKMVFDTQTLDEATLKELLKEPTDDALQDLSEESSGDFETSNRWTPRSVSSQERDVKIVTLSNKKPSPIVEAKKNGQDNSSFVFESRYLKYGNHDGWIQYKYEKSYLLVNQTATRQQADLICKEIGAELAIPQSDEEQSYLNHFLFNMSHCLKNVWIGQNTDNYRNSNIKYKLYANWAKGMPTLTKPCVQIRSPYTIYADTDGAIGGKWEDVACNHKNRVLCQKAQHWSEYQLIRAITDLKKDVEGFKRKLGTDPIPKGFIYIQLPNQLTPKSLWPKYDWKEISTSYAGLFFRVVGGGSASFRHIQESSAPRLIGFKSYGIHNVPPEDLKTHVIKSDNEWTDKHSIRSNPNNGFAVSFKVSDDEVVPRNTAVKVYMRM